ncbi:MAG TPA: cell division protein SepF [Micromonosporaceae bacterium]|jgi:cell division inhibitor SepF
MSALRRAGVWLGLIEDDDERDYGYDDRRYDDDYPDDAAADPSAVVRARVADRLAEARAERDAARLAGERADRSHIRDTEPTTVRAISRPVPVTAASTTSYPTRDNLALAPETDAIPAPRTATEPVVSEERRYQITTLHPTNFNEARAIGEQFRDGVPVIMNLTELPEADAKRLVDFAAGLAFGLRGSMERVTNRVFLLSPANVQVTAEDKAKIAEGGFFYRS